MHKQVSSLLSAGGSPEKLAQYTRILADNGANIRAIGGAEWEGTGAVAVLVDGDMEEDLVSALNGLDFPSTVLFAAEAIIPDESGALASACEAIGGLNIASILVADTHLGKGLVSFGFADEEEAIEARQRLGNLAVDEHGLTDAWQAHEDFDQAHSTPPPA